MQSYLYDDGCQSDESLACQTYESEQEYWNEVFEAEMWLKANGLHK